MKTIHQRLSEVYCRPITEDEWKAIGIHKSHNSKVVGVVFVNGEPKPFCATSFGIGSKEIPTSQFIDLLKDSIVPWRLKEDGFDEGDSYITYKSSRSELFMWSKETQELMFKGRTRNNVKTYSDLITLIKLIG